MGRTELERLHSAKRYRECTASELWTIWRTGVALVRMVILRILAWNPGERATEVRRALTGHNSSRSATMPSGLRVQQLYAGRLCLGTLHVHGRDTGRNFQRSIEYDKRSS